MDLLLSSTRTRLLFLFLVANLFWHTSASAMTSKEIVHACRVQIEVDARGFKNVSPDDGFDVGYCDAAIQSFRSTRFDCGVLPGVDLQGFVNTLQNILYDKPEIQSSNFTTIIGMAFDKIPVRATNYGPRCPDVDPSTKRQLFSQ